MEVFIQLLINGVLLGGIYAIISIGLTLIFGIVRVVNFAHGEFLMAGMYAVYLLNAHLGLHPYVSVVPAVVLLFVVGALVQRFIIQPLLNAEEHIQYSRWSDCRRRCSTWRSSSSARHDHWFGRQPLWLLPRAGSEGGGLFRALHRHSDRQTDRSLRAWARDGVKPRCPGKSPQRLPLS
jgi:Branched-chain amino acid transport system / permease component